MQEAKFLNQIKMQFCTRVDIWDVDTNPMLLLVVIGSGVFGWRGVELQVFH